MRTLSPSLLSRLASGTLLVAMACSAAAQGYPSKPVTILTPLPPGSTVDVLARAFSQQLSTRLKVPVICIIVGEGASGGALGIGVGDRVLMLENTWYSVISPESCSTILWRTVEHKEKAAEALKPTAQDLYKMKIIDGIVKEPIGGAHSNPEETAKTLRKTIIKNIEELESYTPQERINMRIDKYSNMGVYETV